MKRKGKLNGSGVAMEIEQQLPPFVIEHDANIKKLSTQRCPCPGCIGRNHRTTKSKECAYHGATSRQDLCNKINEYLKKTFSDKHGKYDTLYRFSKKMSVRTHIFGKKLFI